MGARGCKHGQEDVGTRGHGDRLGSGRGGEGGGLGAHPNHIFQCSKAPACAHTQVCTGNQPGDEKFHAEQVKKQGETSAGGIWNMQVPLPTLVLQHEEGGNKSLP